MVGIRKCPTVNCVTPAHIFGYLEQLAQVADQSSSYPMSHCGVSKCESLVKSLNLCSTHYLQHHRARRREGWLKDKPTLEQLQMAMTPKSTDANCNVEGCRKARHARGICDKHYAQWSRLKDQAWS
jgi:hypothetical protein